MCPTPGATSPGVEAEGEGGVSEGEVVEGGRGHRSLRPAATIEAQSAGQPLPPHPCI